MSDSNNEQEIPDSSSESQEEAAFAAALSIHYITMALYILGALGSAGMLLLDIAQGGSNHHRAYLLLALLPVLLFIMHLMAVKGLRKRQAWGYKASKGLAFLLLLAFPFGTVLGLFLLSQLSKFRIEG